MTTFRYKRDFCQPEIFLNLLEGVSAKWNGCSKCNVTMIMWLPSIFLCCLIQVKFTIRAEPMINSFVTFDGFPHVIQPWKSVWRASQSNMKVSVLGFLRVSVYSKLLTLYSLSLDVVSELHTNVRSNSLVDWNDKSNVSSFSWLKSEITYCVEEEVKHFSSHWLPQSTFIFVSFWVNASLVNGEICMSFELFSRSSLCLTL